MKNIFIFDLDGTLALIEHRRHLVEGGQKKWDEFYAACVDDEPNEPVVYMTKLVKIIPGNLVYIFSGRSDAVRPQTEAWLRRHDVWYDKLIMRKEGDFTPDEVLKKQWIDSHVETREHVACIFDDRDKVCRMWRSEGFTCFQVAPGAF